MRTLLIILLLPVLLAAQSYSRWNYSDALPNNTAARVEVWLDTCHSGTGASFFDGLIDDLGIWNRCGRTFADSLYNAGSGWRP